MKKNWLIIVAALVIFSFSCTDQENVSKADNQAVLQAVLIDNLHQVNASSITTEKESRSFMRFLCVASAAGLSVAVCSYEYWENNNNLYLK